MSRSLILIAATLSLAVISPAAQATADWLTVAPTCVPDSPATLQFGLTNQTGGFTRRAAGRNPPLAYFCPVWNPDDLVAASTSWKFLTLQAIDPHPGGGQVVATLYAKSRASGNVVPVASVASQSSTLVKVTTAPLTAPVNFKRNAYYVVLTLGGTDMPVEAHMVMLTN